MAPAAIGQYCPRPTGRSCDMFAFRRWRFSLRKGDVRMKDTNRSLVERIFQDAEFIRSLGIELTSCGNGWCETRMNWTPSLCQQHGFIHGGALMTLADHTCGGAA